MMKHLVDIKNNSIFTICPHFFFFLFDVNSKGEWITKNYLRLGGGNREERPEVMLLISGTSDEVSVAEIFHIK